MFVLLYKVLLKVANGDVVKTNWLGTKSVKIDKFLLIFHAKPLLRRRLNHFRCNKIVTNMVG